MHLTTRSCRLGGTTSARMKRWPLSGSTVGCATGLPAFGDGPALCRKRLRWSTLPSHCLPPITSIEQRQSSPCHCLLNTLRISVSRVGGEQVWEPRCAHDQGLIGTPQKKVPEAAHMKGIGDCTRSSPQSGDGARVRLAPE